MTGLEALERMKQPQMLADMDWDYRISVIENELNALDKIVNVLNNYINLIINENKRLSNEQQKHFAIKLQKLLEDLSL